MELEIMILMVSGLLRKKIEVIFSQPGVCVFWWLGKPPYVLWLHIYRHQYSTKNNITHLLSSLVSGTHSCWNPWNTLL